jgi:hypothetical protein
MRKEEQVRERERVTFAITHAFSVTGQSVLRPNVLAPLSSDNFWIITESRNHGLDVIKTIFCNLDLSNKLECLPATKIYSLVK